MPRAAAVAIAATGAFRAARPLLSTAGRTSPGATRTCRSLARAAPGAGGAARTDGSSRARNAARGGQTARAAQASRARNPARRSRASGGVAAGPSASRSTRRPAASAADSRHGRCHQQRDCAQPSCRRVVSERARATFTAGEPLRPGGCGSIHRLLSNAAPVKRLIVDNTAAPRRARLVRAAILRLRQAWLSAAPWNWARRSNVTNVGWPTTCRSKRLISPASMR